MFPRVECACAKEEKAYIAATGPEKRSRGCCDRLGRVRDYVVGCSSYLGRSAFIFVFQERAFFFHHPRTNLSPSVAASSLARFHCAEASYFSFYQNLSPLQFFTQLRGIWAGAESTVYRTDGIGCSLVLHGGRSVRSPLRLPSGHLQR